MVRNDDVSGRLCKNLSDPMKIFLSTGISAFIRALLLLSRNVLFICEDFENNVDGSLCFNTEFG
ncbi:unnamed protein product [Schistosoma mattheei]|uniref:Uncharacterized protein n=1 Tax=Schistosoma mattheei TaxID=31246 RepID=A0A183NH94_9TREM|nr:unnamed protein product [Schistosoma mattheei]